jgi:arylformamidase
MVFSINLERYRLIDLSYLVVPPGTRERPFVVERGRLADLAYKYDIVRTHSHVGTHVETPAHFFPEGKDVAKLPLEAFFGRAVLFDVTDAAGAQEIDGTYLERSVGDVLKPGDILLCRNSDPASGQERGTRGGGRGTRDEGRGVEEDTFLNHVSCSTPRPSTPDPSSPGPPTPAPLLSLPCFTPEAALWLRDRRIKMLGIGQDFSLGATLTAARALHDILMRQDVCLVEFLDGLDQLRRREFFFMALPVRIALIDSSPARAIAIEERNG